MNEPIHRKNKESFGMQTKAPYEDGASKRGGTYISNQVRMHACHLTSKKKKNICTYFWIFTGKSLMRSSKMVEKERSIVVMIIKNQFWSWNKREDGMNPTIRKIPKKWKDQPCNREASSFQPLQSGNTGFSNPWSGIIRKHQVFQPFFCHPLRTSPGKSYFFSHLSYHIFSIWVGRPS